MNRNPKEKPARIEIRTELDYSQYTNPNENENIPESIIEAFVKKIVVSKDGFDWYLRFDGDPNDPLHCTTTGKRKTTTQIQVAGLNSPTMNSSDTGCYQVPKIVI